MHTKTNCDSDHLEHKFIDPITSKTCIPMFGQQGVSKLKWKVKVTGFLHKEEPWVITKCFLIGLILSKVGHKVSSAATYVAICSWLPLAVPPTHPNMKSSWIKTSQKLNMTVKPTSRLRNGSLQTSGWRHSDSAHFSIQSTIVLTWVGEKTSLQSTDWLAWTSTMLTLVFFLTLYTSRCIKEIGREKNRVTFHILYLNNLPSWGPTQMRSWQQLQGV